MLGLFLSAFGALFSVVNPLGAMPIYISLTAQDNKLQRRQTAIRTSIYFTLILLVFFAGGSYLLDFFGISLDAMRIAGGFIIFLSGFSLLRGEFAKSRAVSKEVQKEAVEKDDISLTPMAIPMLAGPGSISLLIGLFAQVEVWQGYLMIGLSVLAMGLVVAMILLASPYLFRIIGVGGLNAISRIMGFLAMAIGVQFVINGVTGIYPISS